MIVLYYEMELYVKQKELLWVVYSWNHTPRLVHCRYGVSLLGRRVSVENAGFYFPKHVARRRPFMCLEGFG